MSYQADQRVLRQIQEQVYAILNNEIQMYDYPIKDSVVLNKLERIYLLILKEYFQHLGKRVACL
jgi:hypothetical protein